MNSDHQDNNPDASESMAMKRKRGRPRKHPRAKSSSENANIGRGEYVDNGENVCGLPGYDVTNRQQPLQSNANAVMVGQPVHGVVDAAFDAGYLLSVRVGNSDTTLRGVVLKPGHYVPVSADNDVAPNIPMTKRSNVPLPTGNNIHAKPSPLKAHRNRKSRLFNESSVTKHASWSKSRQIISIPEQNAHGMIPRANLVPVVLQPANLSNGGPVANQQAAHMSNRSTSTSQAPLAGNQMLCFGHQTGHPVMPRGLQRETGPYQLQAEAEVKSVSSPGRPFEKLLSEVMKRIQPPSQPVEPQSKEQALDVEPLQMVQPDTSVSLPKPFQSYRTGKMTELLKAVQENMREIQAPPSQEPATGSGVP